MISYFSLIHELFEGLHLVLNDQIRMLENFGCKQVEIARDGLEALEQCSEKTFDLILMDWYHFCLFSEAERRESTHY